MDGLCLAVGFLILGDRRPVIREGRITAQLTQFSKSQIKALSAFRVMAQFKQFSKSQIKVLSAFGVMARLHNSVNLESKSCWPFVSWHNSHNSANLKVLFTLHVMARLTQLIQLQIKVLCHGTNNTIQ